MTKQDWKELRMAVRWVSLLAFVGGVAATLGYRLVRWLL